MPYTASLYGDGYLELTLRNTGGFEKARESLGHNANWMDKYHDKSIGVDFLDVGCLECASLDEMNSRGWHAHGFDVNDAAKRPDVTVAPHFMASLFGKKLHAIMCREVIEHVDCWRSLLDEISDALHAGGSLQIQTPRPAPTGDGIGYGPSHLQLFSPNRLKRIVETLGYKVIDSMTWEWGQLWQLRLERSFVR